MTKLSKKAKISLLSSEGIAFAIVFFLLLLLPLVLYKGFAKDYLELKLVSSIDLSMVEWTGGFLNSFLFLLLFEYFRQTRKLVYLLTGCGFLAMGVLNFFYALMPSGTELAIWFKGGALLLGSVLFMTAFLGFKKEAADNLKAFFHFVVPTIVLTLFTGCLLLFVSKVCPYMINRDSAFVNTDFARIVFISIAALFYVSAMLWFHHYVVVRNKIYLLFALIILVFAQMSVVIIYAPLWTIFWWGWHLTFAIAAFVCAIFLLVICMKHSLIWRLLLSLSFIFGITIIITSAVVQSYLDRLYLSIQQNEMNAQQKQYISDCSYPIVFAANYLKQLKVPIEQLLKQELPFRERCNQLEKILKQQQLKWPEIIVTSGVFIEQPEPFRFSTNGYWPDALSQKLLRRKGDNITWLPFSYDSQVKSLVTSLCLPVAGPRDSLQGTLFVMTSVAPLKRNTLAAAKSGAGDGGRIIFNKDSGALLYSLQPNDLGDGDVGGQAWRKTVHALMAKCVACNRKGLLFDCYLNENEYSVFANLIPETSLVLVELVNNEQFHHAGMLKVRHITAYVAMAVLLIGIIILLMLLNFQLAVPLRYIIDETKKLEEGDFTSHIQCQADDELGHLARSYNHMVNELKSSYRSLETLLQAKTEALKFVEKANRSQIIFFENVTHELKTPLHSILNFSRFGLDGKAVEKPEKMKEYFQNINKSAERLTRIIDNLLDMALFEGGDISMDYTRTSLFVIALQVYDELKPMFDEKKVAFRFEKPDFDTTVEVDRKKISQAIKYVLGNALEETPAGSIIKMDMVDCDEQVSISFADKRGRVTGEKLNEVFDRFINQDTSAGLEEGGFELSICKEIIKLHKGNIIAQNLPEQGFVLTFTIPKKRDILMI